MIRRLIGTALLLAGLIVFTLSATAQDKDKLVWKAFEGTKVFYQELETTTDQTLKAMNQETKQKQVQTFYFSYEPKGKDGNTYKVVQKIIGLKMEMEIGGNKIAYDSRQTDKITNPMKEFFKTLEKAEFTLKIDPDKMEVVSVEGVKDFVNKLGAVSPAMQPVLNKILSEDAIKQMANPILHMVPPKGEIPKDKKWERSETLNLGPIGTYGSKHTFTYEGEDKEKKLDKIKVETALSYTKPDDKEASPFPFKIKNATMKSQKADGTIYFDKANGRIAESVITTNLNIDLEVEIANMTTLVNVDQKQVSRLKTTDVDPLKK